MSYTIFFSMYLDIKTKQNIFLAITTRGGKRLAVRACRIHVWAKLRPRARLDNILYEGRVFFDRTSFVQNTCYARTPEHV